MKWPLFTAALANLLFAAIDAGSGNAAGVVLDCGMFLVWGALAALAYLKEIIDENSRS